MTNVKLTAARADVLRGVAWGEVKHHRNWGRDPDEDERRHATCPEMYQSAKASVYRFGARWHWKCGPKDSPSDCHGGPALSQQEAQVRADEHIRAEHVREVRYHDGGNCWCGDA